MDYSFDYVRATGSILVVKDPDGLHSVHYSMEPERITLAPSGDHYGASIVVYGKVTDESGNTIRTGTWNGGVTVTNKLLDADQINELWQLQGLDSDNPMTVTPTSRAAGNISQTISGDGETTSTVTRN